MDRHKPGMKRLPHAVAAALTLPGDVLPAVEQRPVLIAAMPPAGPARIGLQQRVTYQLFCTPPPQLIPSPQRGRGTG